MAVQVIVLLGGRLSLSSYLVLFLTLYFYIFNIFSLYLSLPQTFFPVVSLLTLMKRGRDMTRFLNEL